MAQNCDLSQLDATSATSVISEGASTQPMCERPPWQPLILPAWPSRHHDIACEQSELVHEQFQRFGEGLEQLHQAAERLWEDLNFERQQRLRSEEQGCSALAALRQDFDAERSKQDLVLKHVDECLMNARAEMALRVSACKDEVQRPSCYVDGLNADIGAQLTGVLEKQRAFGDELRLEMRAALSEEHAWCESSLNSLSGSACKSRWENEGLLRLETRIEEECLAGLYAESVRREANMELCEASIALSRKECEALEVSLREVKDLLLSRLESLRVMVRTESQCQLGAVYQRLGETYEQFLNTVRDEECRRLAGDEALRLCTQQTAALVVGRLAATEEMLSERISRAYVESACEAESLAVNAVQRQFISEFGSEQQQGCVNTIVMAAEVRDVRCEFECEAKSQEGVVASLGQCTQQISCLQQAMQEEELAYAVLEQAFLHRTSEIHERTSELNTSLETAISDGLRSVTNRAELCQEELWHVVSSVEERTTLATEELRELGIRTKCIEVDRLGEFSEQLEKVTSLKQDTYQLERPREIVDGLAESTTQDFLESPNAKFRLYLTQEGDVAVYSRNNFGTWAASDFQGIPCWHAGCQPINDRPLCSVNREMQAHEKDRFLGLSNREVSYQPGAGA